MASGERGLPDGYVACQCCSWAGPRERFGKHMTERHSDWLSDSMASSGKTTAVAALMQATFRPKRRSGERNEANAADMLVAMGLDIEARQHEVQLDGGHIYTADLLVRGRDNKAYLVEVKGPYRHGSVGRSRLAFDSALAKTGMGGLWVEHRKASRGKAAHWRVEVMA